MASKRKFEEPIQLEEYVFSIKGYAFRHGIRNRELAKRITTLPVNPQPWDEVEYYSDNSEKASERGDQDVYIDEAALSLQPVYSEENQPAKGPQTIDCIVVGLMPSTCNTNIANIPKRARRDGVAVGFEPPEAEADVEGELLRVVVRMSTKRAADQNSYVCLYSSRGLYKPYRVPQYLVFYFKEFRDATVGESFRTISWNNLVRNAASRETSDVLQLHNYPEPDLQQHRPPAANEAGGSLSELTRHFTSQIEQHSRAMAINPNPWLLNKLEEFVGATIKNLDAIPTKDPLAAFIDLSDSKFKIEDFMSEILKKWPDLGPHLTKETVSLIRRGMVAGNTAVDFRTIRTFLACAVGELEDRYDASNPESLTNLIRLSKRIADLAASPTLPN